MKATFGITFDFILKMGRSFVQMVCWSVKLKIYRCHKLQIYIESKVQKMIINKSPLFDYEFAWDC
jgi:hypothetical protein